jgi:ABC-type uncharacterized transport system permease subunit
VLWADRAARWVICGFGSLVILAVALIVLFISREAAPLFYSPQSTLTAQFAFQLPGPKVKMLSWNTDEFQKYSYGLADDGHFYLFSNEDGSLKQAVIVEDFAQHPPSCVWSSLKGDYLLAGTREGKIKVIGIRFTQEEEQGGSSRVPVKLEFFPLLEIAAAQGQKQSFAVDRIAGSFNATSDNLAIAAWSSDRRLFAGNYQIVNQQLDLRELKTKTEGNITGMVIDMDARYLTLTTSANWLYRWNLWSSDHEPRQKFQPSTHGSYVSSLVLLIGDFTHILGYADGTVEAWFGVRKNPNDT